MGKFEDEFVMKVSRRTGDEEKNLGSIYLRLVIIA
jgi:hypothetical protein